MKLHIFGSCSGTEPYPKRHHCAFAVEYRDALYWFDAGEGCAYTAYRMGLDLMKLRTITISHPHMDHVGGLGNLLWTVRKLTTRGQAFQSDTLDLYLPSMNIWNGTREILSETEGRFRCSFGIRSTLYEDGLLFDADGLRVTALHNHHLRHEEGERWRSFGFLIAGEGKRIVYSGDTGGVDDYAPLLDGCDLLITETGHHHPPEVARELKTRGLFPKTLTFLHHGRDFLGRYDEQIKALEDICPDEYIVFEDGMTLEV